MFLQASRTTPGMALLPLGFGVWSTFFLLQDGKEVNFSQTVVEDPSSTNCSVLCQYQPWEVLEIAGVVQWCGRLHGVVQTILGRGCHFVKPEPKVNNFWQFKVESVEMLSNYILAAPRPKAIPTVPFSSLACAKSIAQSKNVVGQRMVVCSFPGCQQHMQLVSTRAHVAAHCLLGHRWGGEEVMDASNFCLSCGSCSGLCHTNLTRCGKVRINCRVAYTKLHVSQAVKGSKGRPCTNAYSVPVKSCTKWLCTYGLHSHLRAAHPIMAPPYFIVEEHERVAVMKCFGSGRRAQPAINKETPLPILAIQTPMDVVVATAENSSSSISSSNSGSSSLSSSAYMSSASSSSGQSSSASSAFEFVPSEDVSDAGPAVVATRAQCNKPRHLQRGRERSGTQSGNPVTGVMTLMWSNLEGSLVPMRTHCPVLNPL